MYEITNQTVLIPTHGVQLRIHVSADASEGEVVSPRDLGKLGEREIVAAIVLACAVMRQRQRKMEGSAA